MGRSHERMFTRQGGELSVDITGPMLVDGVPVTDRPVSRKDWGKYITRWGIHTVRGKEARARYEQEVSDMRLAGIQRPVQLETATFADDDTLYYVEVLSKNKAASQHC